MLFFDSHAHLILPDYDADRKDAIARAGAAGVTRMLNVGIDAATSRLARDLAREHEGLHASAAVHPNYVAQEGDDGFRAVDALLREGGFVAVGESGLDYYREYSPHDQQRESFGRHIALADELGLPLVVHCREAHPDCRRILAEEAQARDLRDRVVMHCFGGTVKDAETYLELGFWISFSGTVTFKNARAIRGVAASVPLERTLAETDCPFLAPQAVRGRRNEPAFVVHVVQELARVHGVPVEEAARVTTEN
ncbi:MAG: TatD family hydrolase, partial [Planctomycetota bacterium]